jgi:hypothetical protein
MWDGEKVECPPCGTLAVLMLPAQTR